MMRYTIRNELDDATLDDGFVSYGNRRTAIRVARHLARKPSFRVLRLIVWDTQEDRGIADFDLPQS